MRDPRPVAMLAVLQCIALVALALWWLTLEAPTRLTLLRAVWWQEQGTTPPPAAMLAQVAWLWDHRLTWLEGMLGLVMLAGVIGVAEGVARRSQDVLGGFRLSWWTVGVVGLALLPGLGLGLLLAPWPLALREVAGGAAALVGLVGYALAAGRPWVS